MCLLPYFIAQVRLKKGFGWSCPLGRLHHWTVPWFVPYLRRGVIILKCWISSGGLDMLNKNPPSTSAKLQSATCTNKNPKPKQQKLQELIQKSSKAGSTPSKKVHMPVPPRRKTKLGDFMLTPKLWKPFDPHMFLRLMACNWQPNKKNSYPLSIVSPYDKFLFVHPTSWWKLTMTVLILIF